VHWKYIKGTVPNTVRSKIWINDGYPFLKATSWLRGTEVNKIKPKGSPLDILALLQRMPQEPRLFSTVFLSFQDQSMQPLDPPNQSWNWKHVILETKFLT
jgi:hypothetical protein